jgi:ankyrin repeat protein
VRLLLGPGADIDRQDKHGQTPLHAAIESWDTGFAAVLVGLGANPVIPDDDGRTPRNMLRDWPDDAYWSELESLLPALPLK